jgi:hypothetical protein
VEVPNWMAGKTSAGIAMILESSKRTTDSHLDSAQMTTGRRVPRCRRRCRPLAICCSDADESVQSTDADETITTVRCDQAHKMQKTDINCLRFNHFSAAKREKTYFNNMYMLQFPYGFFPAKCVSFPTVVGWLTAPRCWPRLEKGWGVT